MKVIEHGISVVRALLYLKKYGFSLTAEPSARIQTSKRYEQFNESHDTSVGGFNYCFYCMEEEQQITYDKYMPMFHLTEVGPCPTCKQDFLRFSFYTLRGNLSTQEKCCSCRATPQLYLPKQLQSDTIYLPKPKAEKVKKIKPKKKKYKPVQPSLSPEELTSLFN